MIAKTDIVLLLTEMQKAGIDTANDIKQVLNSNVIPLDIIRKINDYKSIDIVNFYDKLRKSYNDKHSKLYKNIMKSDENLLNDPKSALTTLSALLNQILLYKPEDRIMFYKHARGDEISQVLSIYFKTYNIEPVYKLLALTKADIKCLEMTR